MIFFLLTPKPSKPISSQPNTNFHAQNFKAIPKCKLGLRAMANAITQLVASTAISTPSLVLANAKSKPLSLSVDLDKPSLACNGNSSDKPTSLHFQRRIIVWGLAGAVLRLNVGDENAWAAAKRQAAAPVVAEKKDPNVTGLLAKVLASKKRKEAMKEAMAKQREKGKAIEN